jgi:hypothetical protein
VFSVDTTHSGSRSAAVQVADDTPADVSDIVDSSTPPVLGMSFASPSTAAAPSPTGYSFGESAP